MQRVGDMQLAHQLMATLADPPPQLPAPQPSQAELDTCYMTAVLTQCTLPHSDPGDIPAYTRRGDNGTFLGIRPGWDSDADKPLGYPYGPIPRLALFWLTTEVQRKKSRIIVLGRCMDEFMDAIGISTATGRGKRGGVTRVCKQITRLFSSQILFRQSLFDKKGRKQGRHELDMLVTSQRKLLWCTTNPKQQGLFPSCVKLGEYFFEMLAGSAIPVNMYTLQKLKQSSMALDLYTLLNYHTFLRNKKGESEFINWPGLMRQLGSDYSNPKDFAKYSKPALHLVLTHSPGLNVTIERGGITVHPGTTAVPPKSLEC